MWRRAYQRSGEGVPLYDSLVSCGSCAAASSALRGRRRLRAFAFLPLDVEGVAASHQCECMALWKR